MWRGFDTRTRVLNRPNNSQPSTLLPMVAGSTSPGTEQVWTLQVIYPMSSKPEVISLFSIALDGPFCSEQSSLLLNSLLLSALTTSSACELSGCRRVRKGATLPLRMLPDHFTGFP